MPKYRITAWPIDEAKPKYDPAWESIVEANTDGMAHAEGTKLFHEQCSHLKLDAAQFILHVSSP